MKQNIILRISLAIGLLMIVQFGWTQVPSNPTVATAKVVNSFPYFDGNVNTSLGGSNISTLGGCNAACCSTVVYRVEIPPIPGTLRGDINPFTPLAGSMLGYVPIVPNPTSDNQIMFNPGPGNFCGFRDSIQINNLSGGEVFYVLVFGVNTQTNQGNNVDVTFDYIPSCPPGFNCGSLLHTQCDNTPYVSPSGKILTTSGAYQDTLPGAAILGLDSLIYLTLNIEVGNYTQDILVDETVCDTVTHPAYTEMVSYAEFHKADKDWIEVNGVAPALAGTNRSVFMWMRQSTTVSGSSQQLLAINTSGGGNICNLQIGTNEQLQVFDGGTSRNSGVVVTDGNWHHVGYTYDETTNSTLMYVDGVLANSFVNSQSSVATSQFSLGQEFDSGNSTGNFFEGEMTEVTIWNEVLDSAEIALIMQAAVKPNHPKYTNLQGYYPMIVDCEAATDSVVDFSPMNNDGLAVNEDIVVIDTIETISNFNAACHYDIEWSRTMAGVISTADTLLYTPSIADTYALRLFRPYIDIRDDWVVDLMTGCGDTCISTSATISPVACDSYMLPSGGAPLTMSGMYSDTITNVMGCDSIISISLTINQSVNTMANLIACDSAVIGGTKYFSSQTVTDVFTGGATNGCDSTHVTNLTINSAVTASSSLTACDSAVIGGTTYFNSQTVTEIFTGGASSGCDSTHVTNLTINPSVTTTSNLTACDSAVIGGNTYFSSQTVMDIFSGAASNGCDSIHVTNLTINTSATTSVSVIACDSAVIGGTTYFSSQAITDVFPGGAVNGCDSTHVTNLTINPSVTTTASLTACDSAVIGGTTYFSSQVVTEVFPGGAASGCDSTQITNLTVNPSVTINVSLTACDSAVIGGNTYFSSQIVTDVFAGGAMNGCDSTHITNLTISPSVTTTASLTACDSAVIGGNTYFGSQIVTDVFPGGAMNGCDSTHVTNLTINPSVTTTISLTACDSAVIGGTTYFSSQVVTEVFPGGAASGCDSTQITNLTINPSVTINVSLTACDSAVIGGNTYFSSQIVTDVFSGGAMNGCDSTHITNLTISPPVNTMANLLACDSAVIGGNTYFGSQVVTDVFPGGAMNGCDSTHITNLTINPSVTTTASLTACDSAVIGGTTYFSSQTVTEVFPGGAASGCDSTHVTNLTVNPSVTINVSLTACDSAVIGGNTYFSSQIVTDVFAGGAMNGCDSTHITNLIINPSVTTMASLTACDSAVIGGNTYFGSQVVTDVFPGGAMNGCDSTHVTNLTINPSVVIAVSFTSCDSAKIGGAVYFTSQMVTEVFNGGAINGCDSTHITNLTIIQSVTTTANLVACDSAVIGGNTYFSSQIVTDVFAGGSANGCDSTHVTNLTINPSVTTMTNLTACDSAVIGGNTYFSTQTVTDIFPGGSASGCDSTHITNLTINLSVISTANLTACDSAVIGGTSYFSTQTVTELFPGGSANGCDSTHVTNLTINQSVNSSASLVACDSATINGNHYFSSQTVTDIFPSGAASGCDSTHVTTLTITQSVTTSAGLTACDSAVIGGNTYFSSQTVTDLFPGGAANGCDSTHVTNLTINAASATSQSIALCEGESLTVGSSVYTMSGNYADTLQNTAGCDSIVQTALTVNGPILNTVTTAGDSLIADYPNASYQWYECVNDSPVVVIPGATNRFYLPPTNGSYAVEIIENGCSVFSNCISFLVGVQTGIGFEFELYPNPTPGSTFLELTRLEVGTTVEVRDQFGRVVFMRTLTQQKEILELNQQASGMYYVIVRNDSGRAVRKLYIRR